MIRPSIRVALVLVPALLAAACGASDRGAGAGGPQIEVIVDDLDGPTQFVFDGQTIVVAQLNGGENDGTGQIIEIDPSGTRSVLYDNLDKPTGVLVRDDEIWIMERTRLTRGPRAGGSLTVVATDLPNNGRSQGTLTLTPDNDVLFNTSGSARGGAAVERSGRLWTVGDDDEVTEYASGFKHAYAHVFDEDGTLWTTEISDGRFDDLPPADEVVAVRPGADHGWPTCVGDNRPVLEFGVRDCSDVPASHVVFDPGATPTGIAVSPFDSDRLLVTLWVRGEVVSFPRAGGRIDGAPAAEVEVELDDLVGPQHLVVADGLLYLSEFGENRIVRLDLG